MQALAQIRASREAARAPRAPEQWIDARALETASGWSARHLRRVAQERGWRWRWSATQPRTREYSTLTLPAELRSKVAALAAAPADSGAVHLTQGQQAELTARLALIAPMIEFSEGRRAAESLTAVAQQIAAQSKATLAKTWWLYSLWKKGGVAALEPRARADRGVSRAFRKRPELQKFVTAKWAEGVSIAYTADAVRREWGGPLLPCAGTPPCYDAIQRYIESIPAAVREAPLLSKQQWEAKHAPYMVTGRGQWTRPNQCWVTDHAIADVHVSNDIFDAASELARVRLWLTCLQDMRSRAIVGWAWSVNPSWRSIATALRHAVSEYGLPEIVYADNGKDFRKIGAGAQRASLILDAEGRVPFLDAADVPPGLLARLEVKVCYCTPRHPQAKQIESHFHFVRERFDKLFSDAGYTGPKPELRPDACREAEKKHAEFLAGKRGETPLLLASDFIALYAQFALEFNTRHAHSGRGMNGRAPLDVFNGLLPERRIPDMAQLAPLFWEARRCKVSRCKVRVNSATYSAALSDPDSRQGMLLANDSWAIVRFDPNDPACALVFEDAPSGKLLARVESDELLAQGPRTREQVGDFCHDRARLYNACKDTMRAASAGVPRERELLAARAGIQPARRALKRPAVAVRKCVEDFMESFAKAE